MMIPQRPFPFIASRKELRNVALHVLEGAVPDDWYGHVFLNTAAGTVNSGGLPYQKLLPGGRVNQEYASPLINGDGYVIRFDLNQEKQVVVDTALLRPPCYHADVATSPLCNPADNRFWRYAFRSFGLARISPLLGTRNQLNTAFLPFRLHDGEWRMLATFDAGRPFEIDPATLECITPIGENTFWHSGLPPFMRQPFEMVLTTAHPVYDPATREVFSVNFTKTTKALMQATSIFAWNLEKLDEWEEELERKVEGWLQRDIEIDLVEEVEAVLKKNTG